MKIDTHVHTINEVKQNQMSRDELIERAEKVGLGGIIITDHNTLIDSEKLKRLKRKSNNLRIFKGIEVSCNDNFHYLVYGPLNFLPILPEEGRLSPEKLVRIAHEDNNFVAIAHPYRNPDIVLPDYIYDLGLDGVEVKSFNLQSKKSQRKSIELANELDCVAIAGTDHHPHCSDRIGKIGIRLNNNIEKEKDLVDELKAGNFTIYDSVDF